MDIRSSKKFLTQAAISTGLTSAYIGLGDSSVAEILLSTNTAVDKLVSGTAISSASNSFGDYKLYEMLTKRIWLVYPSSDTNSYNRSMYVLDVATGALTLIDSTSASSSYATKRYTGCQYISNSNLVAILSDWRNSSSTSTSRLYTLYSYNISAGTLTQHYSSTITGLLTNSESFELFAISGTGSSGYMLMRTWNSSTTSANIISTMRSTLSSTVTEYDSIADGTIYPETVTFSSNMFYAMMYDSADSEIHCSSYGCGTNAGTTEVNDSGLNTSTFRNTMLDSYDWTNGRYLVSSTTASITITGYKANTSGSYTTTTVATITGGSASTYNASAAPTVLCITNERVLISYTGANSGTTICKVFDISGSTPSLVAAWIPTTSLYSSTGTYMDDSRLCASNSSSNLSYYNYIDYEYLKPSSDYPSIPD